MSNSRTATGHPVQDSDVRRPLPATFLSCYEIVNRQALRWDVRAYRLRHVRGERSHAQRGDAKQAIWALRKRHPALCRGYGFVVDVDEETVFVPSTWNLPSGVREGDFDISLAAEFTTDPDDPRHRRVIAGIIRETIRLRFKRVRNDDLGDLWQDYDRFCQVPPRHATTEFHFCRRFGAVARFLVGNRCAIQPLISTATVDGRTFADYYRSGEVGILTEMIEAKQADRLTRTNRPTAVRVLRDESTAHQVQAAVLNLEEPNLLGSIASLSRPEQAKRAAGMIRCRKFTSAAIDVPLDQLRLIVESQITQVGHSETILDPRSRHRWAGVVRDFLDGMEVHGVVICLSETPFDAESVPNDTVAFPALRVSGPDNKERLIKAPRDKKESALRQRGRDRTDALKTFGFLQSRPINPLLAWPHRFGCDRAERMARDLNYLMERAGIEYRFVWTLYEHIDALNRFVTERGHDTLLAVLPEGWRKAYRGDSTHERIKQRIEVPSQCIHFDHTLPEAWVGRPHRDMVREDARLAQRIRQRYELCTWNLLVKAHWIPFAPCDSFAYNVHIGLDVGGRHNNRAMACLGYGYASPREGLLFRPEEIPIDVQQAEPIPTDCLSRGLLRLFEQVYSELKEAGVNPNFDRTLLFRDGRLLGVGDQWNELDALQEVHRELSKRGWIGEEVMWTAVEVMKSAEGWRVMCSDNGTAMNPTVGRCFFPFEDENTGLLCTTGKPYLSQGTAAPLKINIIDLLGQCNRSDVVRDLVWEADMCFSKPDIGMSLPWVLHVADAGALQVARSYRITGVTV